MNIPFIDLSRQYQAYKKEIDAQINEVITSSSFIMGSKVAELEQQLCEFVGTKHAIGCSSGTDALLLALMAYDVEPGDEIITTPFSFIAASEVIAFLKAKPVFVDIDEQTFNIDPAKIPQAVTDKTQGIIAVDLFGQCADYDAINKIAKAHDLFVIEDAAQSFGARHKERQACSLADIGCTSFFPAKPLGCYGDGGAVFTDDDHIAEIIRSMRVHGKGKNKYDNVRIGINARIDTIQAAVLLTKLKHYEDEINKRSDVAAYYNRHLKECVKVPVIAPDNLSVFAQYCILCQDRDGLQQHLKENNIPTAIHYPKPLHVQPAFSDLKYKEGDFPVSERTCRNILALPMHPFMPKEEQDLITESIKSFYKS
ncbi:MAG: DegT/DnrJ/EryC1/StrS family aminotransferase [Candidatus Omnitrophica bacterium]|nr:DegT/DnrJ/EryC1/StrS family aminotransferase [Candidatus Omnitrophota bacterium]